MAKTASSYSGSRKVRRHKPLSDDISSTGPLRTKSNKRKAKPEDEEDKYVDSRSSRKILKIGQDLVDEEQEENVALEPNPAFSLKSRLGAETQGDEDAEIVDEEWGDEDDEDINTAVGLKFESSHFRSLVTNLVSR